MRYMTASALICILAYISLREVKLTQILLLLLLLQPFNGLFSGTTWVSQYQKGKTSHDLN